MKKRPIAPSEICPCCGQPVKQIVKPPPIDQAIEFYYRSHARGSTITLKRIAEMTGLNYAYLRERKGVYDRAGKWGSKKGPQNA